MECPNCFPDTTNVGCPLCRGNYFFDSCCDEIQDDDDGYEDDDDGYDLNDYEEDCRVNRGQG